MLRTMCAAAIAVAIVQSAIPAAEAKTRSHQSQTKVLKKKVNKLQDQIAVLRKQARALDRQRTIARREVTALRKSMRIAAIPPSPLLTAIKMPVTAPAAAFHDVPVGTLVLGALPQDASRREPHEPQPLIQPMRITPRHRLLPGFPTALAAKVRELETACGAWVTSGHRPGARVVGSGGLSKHHFRLAVDMRGPFACMYPHLANWRGGVNVDASRLRRPHIHFDVRSSTCHFYHFGYGPRGCHYALPIGGNGNKVAARAR